MEIVEKKSISIKSWCILAGLLLFFLCMLAIYGVGVYNDSQQYITMHIHREPLYPLFLAFFRRLCGEGYLPVAATAQGVLAAFGIWMLTAYLAKRFSLQLWEELLLVLLQLLPHEQKADRPVVRIGLVDMGSGVNLQRHVYEPYPDDGTVRFLFMGRVMKERGILEYAAAAEKLHSDRVHFEVLGSCDEDYQAFLNELEGRGVIRQLGFHTEVHPYLARTSAIVVASFHEGMSNTLIEGAATGRPVIASRISGCKEAFEEGVTGFGFTPGKSEELIAAMEKFLALPVQERAEMGRRGREKMEREFDRKIVTASYMEEVSQNLHSATKE